jgi:hypothetical protein
MWPVTLFIKLQQHACDVGIFSSTTKQRTDASCMEHTCPDTSHLRLFLGLLNITSWTTVSISGWWLYSPACSLAIDLHSTNMQHHFITESYLQSIPNMTDMMQLTLHCQLPTSRTSGAQYVHCLHFLPSLRRLHCM